MQVDKASGLKTSDLSFISHRSADFEKIAPLPHGPLKRMKGINNKKKSINYLCRRSPWLWCRASGDSPSGPEWPPCRAAARWETWRKRWSCTSAGRDQHWNINNLGEKEKKKRHSLQLFRDGSAPPVPWRRAAAGSLSSTAKCFLEPLKPSPGSQACRRRRRCPRQAQHPAKRRQNKSPECLNATLKYPLIEEATKNKSIAQSHALFYRSGLEKKEKE